MFLKDLNTSEKCAFPLVTTAPSFYKPSTLSWGYEWLNWQQRCKCHWKCQQWKRGYWNKLPSVVTVSRESFSALREFREQCGLISCHRRHIMTSNSCHCGNRTKSSSVAEELFRSFTLSKSRNNTMKNAPVQIRGLQKVIYTGLRWQNNQILLLGAQKKI